MPVHTLLLDFSVNPKHLENESVLLTNMENILRDYLRNLNLVSTSSLETGVLKLYTSDMDSIINVRVFCSGLITITIEYYREDGQEPLLSYEHIKKIEQKIYVTLNCSRSKSFPPIKRGGLFDPYLTSSVIYFHIAGFCRIFIYKKCKELEHDIKEHVIGIICSSSNVPIKRGLHYSYYPTSDERLIEYDIDQLVFEETSQFQKVQIVHSKTLGNMLVLDDLQNISEADLIYTETIMEKGKECYTDKEIVILGGGDGGLLYELLKENPKHVLMLEIDEVVMKACAKHLRSICGDVLDNRTGSNYEIIIGDCMKLLREFVTEGRKFDYVFGDLTDIPINSLPTSEIWDFIKNILDLAFKVLKPDGKFMTHGNGANCEDALLKYEALLAKFVPPVSVSKSKAYIPSFMEDWVFYQICFANVV